MEQQRFLRHLARHWEVHRHRMAPQTAILIRGLVADGQLTAHRAHLSRITATRRGLEAVSRTGTTWHVGTVVNCCGPGAAERTPLGRTLLDSGMARPDSLGAGLEVDARGHLVARGWASTRARRRARSAAPRSPFLGDDRGTGDPGPGHRAHPGYGCHARRRLIDVADLLVIAGPPVDADASQPMPARARPEIGSLLAVVS